MKNFTFHKSPVFLRVVFVVSVAVIFFISAMTYKHLLVLNNSSKWVTHSYDVSLNLEKLFTYIKELEVARRDYILTQDKTDLEMMTVSKLKVEKTMYIIDLQTRGNVNQQKNILQLKDLINKQYNFIEDYSRESKAILTDVDLKMNLLASKKIIHDLKIKIYEMINLEIKVLKERQEENNNALAFTPIILYVTQLITLAIVSLAFVRINKDLQEIKTKNNDLVISNEISNLAEEVGNYGSWHWDLVEDKMYYSDNMFKMLGVEKDAFQPNNENYAQFVHPDDKDFVNEQIQKMKNNQKVDSFSYRIVNKDGEIRYRKAVGKLVNRNGKNSIVGTTIDITEERNINNQIEDRNRELERNNRELEAFNYVASHDLQEPLRKIQTFISRLDEKEKHSLSDNGKAYLERIKSAATRMRLLIDDLLQFSRTNKTEKVFELSDLNELLNQSTVELSQEIEKTNTKIIADKLPIVNVIPFQIQQMFTNLISNSIKYRKPNSSPEIQIKYTKVNAEEENLLPLNLTGYFYKFQFIDNGIGFEQQYAEKIFILFNRLHNKEEYQGTGIGLAICKKIIDNHKGYIIAKGEPDLGATFTFFLPV